MSSENGDNDGERCLTILLIPCASAGDSLAPPYLPIATRFE
jgi:hypothetical protein